MPAFNHANSRALRRGRWSESGRAYLVTFTTLDRERHFAQWDTAAFVAKKITTIDAWPHVRLLSWVVMPDHVHALIELGEAEALSRTVGRAKAFIAREWRDWRGGAAPLWAAGFHDRAIRHDDALVEVAHYIVANPVRAGLVDRIGDYPFWDAVWLSR